MDFWTGILNPQGLIAHNELSLMIQATLLMLVVVVPVYILVFFFAWYYRAGNTKATYVPNWEHAKLDELVWWAIPFEIVLILGALTWTSTHALDPHKPLPSSEPPLTIQVVALPAKWLFIYPEQNIATVNTLAFPVDRPVEFQVTADAPMNSFWIPELGGQIYAMTGMATTLHLVANEIGEFKGMSANYSGEGFAQMKFVAHSLSQKDFESWVVRAKASSQLLTEDTYEHLVNAQSAVAYYSEVEEDLFQTIVSQFNYAR